MLSIQPLKIVVPPARVRSQSTLFSNQVIHLEDGVLDAARCCLVSVGELAGALGVYCKTELRAVRLLPRVVAQIGANPTEDAIVEAFAQHLRSLAERKRKFVPKGAFRWAHGEADGLPGLVIDDYGTLVVVQSSAAAGDFLLPHVSAALSLCAGGRPVFERSSGQTRSLAGLPERTRALQGEVPELVSASFAGLSLEFSPRRAQKTGLFLDQRTNLLLLEGLLAGAGYESALDVCCYAGAWSAAAAKAGLTRFVLVDQDKDALMRAESNVRLNARTPGLAIETQHGDMFEALAVLAKSGAVFDVVVGDPPAFAKSKKHIPEARRAYARLTKLAARLVRPGGLYVACSCSRNMEEVEFQKTVEAQLTADGSGAWDLVLRGSQAADHTVPAGDGLSSYLKCFFYRRREGDAAP